MGVHRRGDTDRGKRGIQDDDAWIVQPAGEPGGCDEKVHETQLTWSRHPYAQAPDVAPMRLEWAGGVVVESFTSEIYFFLRTTLLRRKEL